MPERRVQRQQYLTVFDGDKPKVVFVMIPNIGLVPYALDRMNEDALAATYGPNIGS